MGSNFGLILGLILHIPNIIDIEASGFGLESYPIEVGVILSNGDKYCSLIKPIPEWTHWCKDAENTHNIRRDILLEKGRPVHDVAQELNQLLGNQTVYCDGWVVDLPWLNALYTAARMERQFKLSPMEFILKEYQLEIWQSTKLEVIEQLGVTRHRASSDAQIIQETFRRTRSEANSLHQIA